MVSGGKEKKRKMEDFTKLKWHIKRVDIVFCNLSTPLKAPKITSTRTCAISLTNYIYNMHKKVICFEGLFIIIMTGSINHVLSIMWDTSDQNCKSFDWGV